MLYDSFSISPRNEGCSRHALGFKLCQQVESFIADLAALDCQQKKRSFASLMAGGVSGAALILSAKLLYSGNTDGAIIATGASSSQNNRLIAQRRTC